MSQDFKEHDIQGVFLVRQQIMSMILRQIMPQNFWLFIEVQVLHLEALHQPFFVKGFSKIGFCE
jgi:hypothetical protein